MEKIYEDTDLLDIVADSEESAVVLDSDDDDAASFGNDSISCKQWRSGYIRRGVYAVCTPTICGNDFAAVKAGDKFSSLAYGSIHSDPFSQKQLDIKDVYPSEREVVESFPSQDYMGCNGHMDIVDNKTKIIQGLNKVSSRNMIDEDYLSENKCEVLANEMMRSNTGQKAVKLRDSESQESEDLSQANALGFVDHYISMNNMHFLEKVTPGMISRPKSPPVSCAKGSQSMARRAVFGTSCGLSRTFEWDDDIDAIEEHVLQNKDTNSKVDVSKARSVKHSCNQKLLREKTYTEFSKPLKKNKKSIDEVDQVSKMNFVKDLDDELNEERSLQIETGDVEENVPDAYDVGFDTQMAAEAMDALFYALPSNFNVDHAHQDSCNITGNSSVVKDAHFNSGITKRKFKQKHGSSKKLNRQRSKSTEMNEKKLDHEMLESNFGEKRKRLRSLNKNDSNPVRRNASVHSCNSSVYFIEQGTKAKALCRDGMKKVDEDLITSEENDSCGQVPLQKEKRNLSSIAHRTGHSSKGSLMDETKDLLNNAAQGMNGGMELGILKRRQNNEISEMLHGFTVKRKRSSCFLSSGDARNVKVSQKQQKYVSPEPVGWHLKLDVWSFPKGKRKHRNARHQWNGLNLSHRPILVKGETSPSSSIGSPKKLEESSGSSCLKVYVRRKSRLLVHDNQVQSAVGLNCKDSLKQNSKSSCLKVYVRRKSRPLVHAHQTQSVVAFNCEDSLGQNPEVQSFANVLYRGFPATNEELTVPLEDNFESSRLCGSMDGVGPTSPATDTSKPLEKPRSTNASPSGNENQHQLCDRKYSRVPLVKELFGLEISDSGLTNESKHSRRRRDMKSVRVLFSKNMDDAVLKKQKKVLGRLGSYIAYSCSEATHFVADRFVRTKNMLEAIALGKPVVTHMWLESCGQAMFFVDEKNYLLRDAKKEREIGFSMPVSLANARKTPLLKGRRVYVTPNINPGKELIVGLVKAVNGEVLSEAEDRCHEAVRNEMISDDILILSCEQDYALCEPFLEQGAEIYSSELLLNGIIIQKLEFERHRIFKKTILE